MKKVLVISYYWPPAGGGGIQRTVKFCKYLRLFGWEPFVLTVENGDYNSIDSSFIKDAEGIQTYYSRQILFGNDNIKGVNNNSKEINNNSGNVKKKSSLLKSFIRINLLIPDAKIFWYPDAIRKARELIEKEKFDLIFSTSPPYTTQLIGLKIKQKYNIPWVVDFRDPWVENIYYNTVYRNPITKYINKVMEKKVLKNADMILTIGDNLKKMLGKKTFKEIRLIANGYDTEDFKVKPESKPPKKFIIGYYGSLNSYQIPIEFLRMLNSLRAPYPELYERLELHFAGNNTSSALYCISKIFPKEKIKIFGYLNHASLIEKLCETQILLQLIHDQKDNEVIIGSKLYEYIPTGNPILCIGNKESDGAKLVKETNAGNSYSFEEVEDMKDFVLACYEKWEHNCLNEGRKRYEIYERKNLTNLLAEIFNSLV